MTPMTRSISIPTIGCIVVSLCRLFGTALQRGGFLVLAPMVLVGCIATGSPVPQSAMTPADVPVAAKPTTSLAAKDDKLLEEGKVVNDYVNSNVPSQVSYSLQMLNAEPAEGDYPQIADIEAPVLALKTEEERKRIEEELRILSSKNSK
ncbi:hypothetical protein [Cohaesibacter celericrescens]